MNRAVVLTLVLAPAIAPADEGTISFASGAPVALSSNQSAALFNQCSRGAPRPEKIVGLPTLVEISALEGQVARDIAERSKYGMRVPPAGAYAKQYVAFLEGGRRKIYANFFPPAVNDHFPPLRAVVVCDGGARFWGVVYDPERNVVEQLEMNGAL